MSILYPKDIQDKGYISLVAKVLEISNVSSFSCEEVLEVGLQTSEHFIVASYLKPETDLACVCFLFSILRTKWLTKLVLV